MARHTTSLVVATVLIIGITAANSASGVHVFDPFGGADNRSLVLDNFDGGGNPVSWPFVSWEFGDQSRVVVEFDLWMAFSDRFNPPSPTTSGAESWWTYADIRFGDTNGGVPSGVNADTAVYGSARVEVGSGAYFFNNATAPSNGHPFLPETAQRVKYDIDLNTNTYTLEVTPHAVGGETFVQEFGSDDNPVRNAFIFGTSTTIDTFAIGSAWNPGVLNATPFFIDNVLITDGVNTLIEENFDDDPIGGLADTPFGHFAGAQDQNGNGFIVEVVGPVPEPSSLLLALMVLSGLTAVVRRR